MNRPIAARVLAAGLPCLMAASPVAASTSPETELRFEVLLDDRPIGYHQFRIGGDGDRQRVESEARFDVRVLFVPVYRYRHQNTEVWRDGCLATIQSQTDANGERYEVEGEQLDDGFRLETLNASRDYDTDCPATFAYWDRDFLSQRRLINAQTGELVEVEVQAVGERVFAWSDREVAAEGYRLSNAEKQVDIRVWYAKSDGRWVALESTLPDGKQMRYEPVLSERLALQGSGQGPGDVGGR